MTSHQRTGLKCVIVLFGFHEFINHITVPITVISLLKWQRIWFITCLLPVKISDDLDGTVSKWFCGTGVGTNYI